MPECRPWWWQDLYYGWANVDRPAGFQAKDVELDVYQGLRAVNGIKSRDLMS